MKISTSQNNTIETAKKVFQSKRVALFIVTYNAEKHIAHTLSRIPEWLRPLLSEIYVIDDSSTDNTISHALHAVKTMGLKNVSVMKTPNNQGYGGNQKIGYTYAIEKKHDIVILLHGDGQYPPENIPEIVACYIDTTVGAVFGSRMMKSFNALRGGMPLYKWIGNKILTFIENTFLKTKFTEYHSGYRSYRVDILRKIPFQLNSDDFQFDTDIIIQLIIQKCCIMEIPMPTYYGSEKCHVNGIEYAWGCFKSAVKFRLHNAGVFFQPNFEISEQETRNYTLKKATTSLHFFIQNLPWKKGEHVLDLGANDGLLAKEIVKKEVVITAADINIPDQITGVRTIRLDANMDFVEILGKDSFDKIIALDIIEHLYLPEKSTKQIHQLLKEEGILYASTANIGYIIMRLSHLLGWFNYGKKGILDQTHHHLYTIGSFKRLLHNTGFEICEVKGFGPPIVDHFGLGVFWRTIDHICWLLARLYPKLFSFNFLIMARKKISVEEKTELTKIAQYRGE